MNGRAWMCIGGLAMGLSWAQLASAGAGAWPGSAKTLDQVEADVARRYTQVTHLDAAQLNKLREQAGASLVLLDAREPEEFAVSHLEGARRVDPGANADEVLGVIGAVPAGAHVVVYCLVGERSSRLAESIAPALMARGAVQVANLRGGIFAWHN